MCEVILGDDDADVARELEVDLRKGAVVGAPRRQGSRMQRVRSVIGVEESRAVRIKQMTRVRLLGGRVERGRGRGAVGGVVVAFAAEELADHVVQRAVSSESSVPHSPQQLFRKA